MGAFDDLIPNQGGAFDDLIPKEDYSPTSGMSGFDKFAAGAGKAVTDMGRGVGQIFGMVSQQDIDEAKARDAALMDTGAGMAGNFAGTVAALAPTALIPGAGTVTGAAAIGGLQGALLTPGGLVDRAKAALFGAGGGAAGAKAGQYLSGRLAAQEAEGAANASRNAVRDATLNAGQDAGYVIPPSTVNPSFLNNRLESLAGKAAVGQEAGRMNQDVTNALARKSLGMADDAAISEGAIKQVRSNASGPYKAVSSMSQDAADALELLKQARFYANEHLKHYARSADPAALVKAQAAKVEATGWEQFLEQTAQANGNPALIDSLRQARQTMAKAHTVDRALNTSTGNVVATDLGRMIDKGAPLTGELATAGRFADAFPQFAREGSKIPTPGVSKLEHLAAAALAMGGGAAGGPAGALLGALPYTAGAARKLLLSKWYQQLMAQPNYSVGLATRAAGQLTPQAGAVTGMSLADLVR